MKASGPTIAPIVTGWNQMVEGEGNGSTLIIEPKIKELRFIGGAKRFWAGALASMGGVDRATVDEALHELSLKEIVRPSKVSSIASEAEYLFWHALIRDVAYGQIPRRRRAAKHVAAAAWIDLTRVATRSMPPTRP